MTKSLLITISTAAVLTFSACSSENQSNTTSSSTKQTTEIVTFKGTPFKLEGTLLSVGDTAPEVVVVTKSLKEKTLGGKSVKAQIIVVVPSIDTPVCNLESRTFNERVADMKDVDLTIVSMDSPFALGRFCAAKGIENITMASDYRYNSLGKAYGVRISESILKGILARAIFVVKEGKIVYKELVDEVSHEPNYDAALKAI
jgi:thioredoxin-dependent peroxiredoxin